MNEIKSRAHSYAQQHSKKNEISLMRAYVDGAIKQQEIMKHHIKNTRIKVFISGKVSGEDYYTAYRKFSDAEKHLEKIGYNVINPMMLCRREWSWLRCMIVCIRHLLSCHCIYQLSNWQQSRGARIENFIAKLFNKTFL